MTKLHKCPTGRSGEATEVRVIKEGRQINIQRGGDLTFTDVLVSDIRFCPFCGMNLYQAKK